MTGIRSLVRPSRLARAAVIASAAAALGLTAAGAASALSYASYPLSPSQGACTPAQYAAFQVRADGWATNQGAKFKLLRNGVVVTNTPTRVNAWAAELRTAYGNFPGPGYYSVCAQNTGTANTIATMELRTDSEF